MINSNYSIFSELPTTYLRINREKIEKEIFSILEDEDGVTQNNVEKEFKDVFKTFAHLFAEALPSLLANGEKKKAKVNFTKPLTPSQVKINDLLARLLKESTGIDLKFHEGYRSYSYHWKFNNEWIYRGWEMKQEKSAAPSSMQLKMHEWQKKGNLSDVVIQVGERQFAVHSLVLQVYSDYFLPFFNGQFKESNSSILDLSASLTAPAMEKLIEHIYLEETTLSRESIATSDLISLSLFAKQILSEKLEQACNHELLGRLGKKDFFALYTYADQTGQPQLLQACAFYAENHPNWVDNMDFSQFAFNDWLQAKTKAQKLNLPSLLDKSRQALEASPFTAENFAQLCQLALEEKKSGSNDKFFTKICKKRVQGQEEKLAEMKEARDLYIQLRTGIILKPLADKGKDKA